MFHSGVEIIEPKDLRVNIYNIYKSVIKQLIQLGVFNNVWMNLVMKKIHKNFRESTINYKFVLSTLNKNILYDIILNIMWYA